ncbi:RsmD family RNA methyltransferase [Nocardioides hungaricus]
MTTTPAAAPPTETMGFGPLRITFDGRVLRPRTWTATQSEWAAGILRTAPPGAVLELCAGAGQIGLLAVLGSERRLVCVDVNPAACAWVRHNAEEAGLAHRVEVREGPMDEVLRDSERFAMVVADPPWVRRDDVGDHPEDPVLAIDGGADGMDVAWLCVGLARAHLASSGTMSSSSAPSSRSTRCATGSAATTSRSPSRSPRCAGATAGCWSGSISGSHQSDGRSLSGSTLCVPSHHGSDCDLPQRQTALTGRVVSCGTPSASSIACLPRSSIGPPGHSTTSGWSKVMPPRPGRPSAPASSARTGPRGRGMPCVALLSGGYGRAELTDAGAVHVARLPKDLLGTDWERYAAPSRGG